MRDKNGVELYAGDIVKIEGAYFKTDNGLYYIEEDGSNPCYLDKDSLVLKKIGKTGKISISKYSTTFFPIMVTVSDPFKRQAAKEHNKKYATIEKVYDVRQDEVYDLFSREVKDALEAVKYYELRGYDEAWTSQYNKKANYYKSAMERMRGEYND